MKSRQVITRKEKKIIGELTLPSTIFSKKLGCLETVVKYLKENLDLGYSEIASLLNRNERTIWTVYNRAIRKKSRAIEIKKTLIFIPVSILKNRKLTISESIITYLRKKELTYNLIAKLLDRNRANVWHTYSIATRKTKLKKPKSPKHK